MRGRFLLALGALALVAATTDLASLERARDAHPRDPEARQTLGEA